MEDPVEKYIVRYRPKAELADENERRVEAVFAELAETAPEGLRYAAFRLADGTFVHVADVEADTNPLSALPAFRHHLSDVSERCDPGATPDRKLATIVKLLES